MAWFNIYWEIYSWQLTCIANSNPYPNSSVKPPNNLLKDMDFCGIEKGITIKGKYQQKVTSMVV